MQEKELVPEHSVRGYLGRQSTEKLQMIHNDYLQQNFYQTDRDTFLMILDILQSRATPDNRKATGA